MRFVHLAPASCRAGIRRRGVQGRRSRVNGPGGVLPLDRAVYAVPASGDGGALRWLGDRQRVHQGRMVAVIFDLPRDQPVLAGCDGAPHRVLPAASVRAWFRRHHARSAEIVVPRSVAAEEIVEICAPEEAARR